MSLITEAEREDLGHAIHAIAACPPAVLERDRGAARQLVDATVDLLPGVDPVDIGRVLAAAAAASAQMTLNGLTARQVENVFILAALDLLADQLVTSTDNAPQWPSSRSGEDTPGGET